MLFNPFYRLVNNSFSIHAENATAIIAVPTAHTVAIKAIFFSSQETLLNIETTEARILAQIFATRMAFIGEYFPDLFSLIYFRFITLLIFRHCPP